MSNIRVRIAPSPTGPFHIGTARTALFNYLFAKKMGGDFVVRIEDTDLERSEKKFEKNILDGLVWLGIEGDEGPTQGGPYAPYRQTERTSSYKKYIEQLLADGNAFYCFHTEEELDAERAHLLEMKKPQVHFCEFRTMDPSEARILAGTNPNHIIRFKAPLGRVVVFSDVIRGELAFESDLIGDFSIAKRPDVPLYNFAVVVDDEEMKISHVIRGEDHISNTPKQILLIEALGFKTPVYAHLPLILGEDRSKLSKRHGATSIDEYRAQGYLPETLFNFIALLGWHPEDADGPELFLPTELPRLFSLERVQKGGAIFDVKKLNWMNGEYIRKKTASELTTLVLPFLSSYFGIEFPSSEFSLEYIESVVGLEQPRLTLLSEIGERVEYFFREPAYEASLLLWKQMTREDAMESIDASIGIVNSHFDGGVEKIWQELFAEAGRRGDRGSLLWPLRVALSGRKASPGPFEIMKILGIPRALKRLQSARTLLES